MRLLTLAFVSSIAIGSLIAEPVMAQTVIKVWANDGIAGPGIIDTLSDEWNAKNDDVKIEYRRLPFDEIVNETLRAIAIGQAPDIVSIDNPNHAMFSSRGAFLDLTDRVAASEVIHPEVYFPGPLNSASWDGKLYGVPRFSDTIGLFYNKELFAKAGITEPPKTWSELVETAAKLTDPSNNVFGITFSARASEETTYGFLPWIQMAGGGFEKVNVPGAVQALEIWKTMIDQRSASPEILNMGWWDSTGTFNSGNAAMAIAGPWELTRMVNDAKFAWGVAILPAATQGGARASALGGWNFAIPTLSRHPDAAFKVVEFFVSQDHRIFPEFGRIPARHDIQLPPSGHQARDEAQKIFVEGLQYARPRGPHPQWHQISKAIYDAVQAALTGQKSAQDALDEAQKTIERILG